MKIAETYPLSFPPAAASGEKLDIISLLLWSCSSSPCFQLCKSTDKVYVPKGTSTAADKMKDRVTNHFQA